jgi:adenylate cyclase class IV
VRASRQTSWGGGQAARAEPPASNVEWKARARDPRRRLALAGRLAGGPPELQEQVDTFFAAPHGRLKPRRLSADRGELIHHDRPDRAGPKQSVYSVVPTGRPDALRGLLARALGLRGEARKRRRLCRAGGARVHLDKVEGLGTFLGVEVVLQAGQPAAEGERLADELRRRLDVGAEEMIDFAHVDLLAAGQAPSTPGGSRLG